MVNRFWSLGALTLVTLALLPAPALGLTIITYSPDTGVLVQGDANSEGVSVALSSNGFIATPASFGSSPEDIPGGVWLRAAAATCRPRARSGAC